jgi:hypothetical protein
MSIVAYEGFDYPSSLADGTLLTSANVWTSYLHPFNNFNAVTPTGTNIPVGAGGNTPNVRPENSFAASIKTVNCKVNRSQALYPGSSCLELAPQALLSVYPFWASPSTGPYNNNFIASSANMSFGFGFWIKYDTGWNKYSSTAQTTSFTTYPLIKNASALNTASDAGPATLLAISSPTYGGSRNSGGTDGYIQTAYAGGTNAAPAISTPNINLFDNQWHWIELVAGFSTSLTAQYYRLYIDYSEITPGIVQWSSSAITGTYYNYFRNEAAAGSSNMSIFLDDIIVYFNAAGQKTVFPLGRQRISRKRAIAAGSNAQFTPSDNTKANYQLVQGTTTGNSVSTTQSAVDTYKFAPLDWIPDKINGVGYVLVASNTMTQQAIYPMVKASDDAAAGASTLANVTANLSNTSQTTNIAYAGYTYSPFIFDQLYAGGTTRYDIDPTKWSKYEIGFKYVTP